MKDLGYANGWYGYIRYPDGFDKPGIKEPDNIPAEYTACTEAGHIPNEVTIGRCLTQATCHICKITWKIDSSD